MATIKQIAKLAGVSRGTVDRVLNNRGLVSEKTEARVKEIAKALNYTPNKAGKSLAIKRKNLKIGFILFSSKNPFFKDVIKGIKNKEVELKEYGMNVEIRYSEFDDYLDQIKTIDDLVKSGINGLAITPINHEAVKEKLLELKEKNILVVTVNTDINDSGRIAYVGSNYYMSGRTAGNLMGLLTKGDAKVGIVTGSDRILCHAERVLGFKRSIEEDYPGIQVICTVKNHDDDIESFEATKRMLTEHPEINALYLSVAGVYGACKAVISMGLGGKITIISYDAVPSTKQLVKEGIIAATIDQQPQKQGELPLEILFNVLALDYKQEVELNYTDIVIKIRENI